MKLNLYLLVLILLLANCKKNIEREPTVIKTADIYNIKLTTNLISNIKGNEATTGGTFTYYGDSLILEKGICWSLTPNPDTSNFRQSSGWGMDNFISKIEDLLPDTTYFARAYAVNKYGVFYGNENSFKTLKVLSVATYSVLNVTRTTATFSGRILSVDGLPIFEQGFYYSDTWKEPTRFDNTIRVLNGTSPFSVDVSSLKKGTTYYVRAFAKNINGYFYGKAMSFTTQYNKYELGDSIEGGFIFYLDASGEHGLLAANKDVATAKWGCEGTSVATVRLLVQGLSIQINLFKHVLPLIQRLEFVIIWF